MQHTMLGSMAATAENHKNSHLSPGAYRALGTLAAVVGLGASAVAAWFFWLGLLHSERDAASRLALMAGCALMTTGQLGSFGIAALLPSQSMRELRRLLLTLGIVLFAFEVTVIGVTQLTLVHSADTAADAASARMAELQRAIDSRRATAATQRDLATAQTQAQAITAAARSLRQAADIEAGIEPLAAELAQLQAARVPTLSTVLGDAPSAWFVITRSALIALTGLVAMSAAGTLFRAARDVPSALPPMATPKAPVTRWGTALPGRVTAAAATPLAVLAGVQPATAAGQPVPHTPDPVPASVPAASTGAVRVAVPAAAEAPVPQAPAGTAQVQGDSAGVPADLRGDRRFLEVRHLVRTGALQPTVRDIKTAACCGTDTARRYRNAINQEGQA